MKIQSKREPKPPDEQKAIAGTKLMGIFMIALGVVLFLFVVFAHQAPHVLFPAPLYVLIFAAILNASNPLRQRILPTTINNIVSIIGNFGAATVLIYLTGGAMSGLYIIYFLIPALGALYFGRVGIIVCLLLVSIAYSLFFLPSILNPTAGTLFNLLLQLALLMVISLPFALFVEYERVSIQKLQKSYEELEQTNKKLKETQAQMVQAAKMSTLGQMATSIVHELSQPLASLNVYTKLALSKAARNQALKEDLTILKEQLEKMNVIVRNIRNFSHKAETRMAPLDMNECTANILRLVSKQFESCHIETKLKLSLELPKILGDKNQIEQVILNILTNAKDGLESVTEHERELLVETKLSSDGRFVETYVCDNGCGIPAESKEKIFEPFFTTKDSADGLGLGLPICKQIIENHQGTIEVTGTAGRGTTVKVQLPVKVRLKTED